MHIKFWTFGEQNKSHSLSISQIIEFERRGYLSA